MFDIENSTGDRERRHSLKKHSEIANIEHK